MMVDILLTNQEKVLNVVNVYQAQLRDLARLVKVGDEENLRQVLFYSRGKNKDVSVKWRVCKEGL